MPSFEKLTSEAWDAKDRGRVEESAELFMSAALLGRDIGVDSKKIVHTLLPAARQNWLAAGRQNATDAMNSLDLSGEAIRLALNLSSEVGYADLDPAGPAIVLATSARYEAARKLILNASSDDRKRFAPALVDARSAVNRFDENGCMLARLQPDWAAQALMARRLIAGLSGREQIVLDEPDYLKLDEFRLHGKKQRSVNWLAARVALRVSPGFVPLNNILRRVI